jgi:hypothetical protein
MNTFVYDLPFSDYLALDAMSISSLKLLRESPLKFKHALTAPRNETASMALGTAAHCAILEPRKFNPAVFQGATRRGKDWDAFLAAHAGELILKQDDVDLIHGMRNSVRSYAPAMKYLVDGQAEVTMLWTDATTGRKCRGRIDWLTSIDGRPVIIDLKTTRSAKPMAFGGQAAKLGYHLQMAYYYDGFVAITGEAPRMAIVAVESAAPFEPAVFSIPEDVILQGREEYQQLLSRLAECEESNHWPPALETESDLSLPTWAYSAEDDDVAGLGLIA